jgi:hypothetical protein
MIWLYGEDNVFDYLEEFGERITRAKGEREKYKFTWAKFTDLERGLRTMDTMIDAIISLETKPNK